MTIALWEPETDEEGRRTSALTETADLLGDLVAEGTQTVAFARSRVGVEVVAQRARERLESRGRGWGDLVAAYRGGYLPEERRELEAALRDGRLRGLAATTALELGIDISGLDAVVMAGWPGRRASFWQQAGRAGRRGQESLAVLVAADDPLDTYLVHHPEAIFGAGVETTVVDPANPYVLAPHLACAAAELPLTDDDERWFGASMPALIASLERHGLLRRRPTGWYWTRPDRAVDHVSLRGSDRTVSLVERRTGRVLGTIDEARSHTHAHTGAVYVHQGRTHVVTHLDLDDATALVVAGDPGWVTQARTESAFDIVATEQSSTWLVTVPDDAGAPQPFAVPFSFGPVTVRSQVTGFLRRLPGGEVIGEHPLDLPERALTTKGVWFTLPEGLLDSLGIAEIDRPGTLHAAEHAMIGMLPLVATADRWDVGGVSTALHPDTGLPTVLVYDGTPGGAGFAERGHEVARDWLAATLAAVEACECTDGCPGCVHSPKCGNGNEPLDKQGAATLLRALLGAG